MNSGEERVCLQWNDFQENAISSFGTLRKDMEFSDVTLVCEDGQQVEAHRVILASSSNFFLNLLRKNKHPHPLIFMRGVKSEHLVAMVDYLYCGEANVLELNLDSFLDMAEELQLKGLMRSGAEKETDAFNKSPVKKKTTLKERIIRNHIKQESEAQDFPSFMDKVKIKPLTLEGDVNVDEYSLVANLQDLDEKIKFLMEVSENVIGGRKKRICRVCGKEGPMNSIQTHIESHHITGVIHTCNICGITAPSRPALAMHKVRKH